MSAPPWALRILTRNTGLGQAKAIGTGILLPGDRVLTCAHVVDEVRGGETIAVDSPSFAEDWWAGADVIQAAREGRADFAVLSLKAPAPETMRGARLRRLGPFDGRRLSTCGYPAGGDAAIWCYYLLGELAGRPGRVQMLRRPPSPGIMRGCSGSAVRDDRTDAVVGLLVSAWNAVEQGHEAAFMVPVDEVVDALPELGDCMDGPDYPLAGVWEAEHLLSQIRPHRLSTLVRSAVPLGDALLQDGEPEDAGAAFRALLDRNAPLSGIPPSLFFADLVLADAEAGRADTAPGARPLGALRAWIGEQAARIEEAGASPVRVSLAERRVRLSEQARGECHVLLRIEREGERPDDARRRLSAWRSGPEEWLPERVVDAVVPAGSLADRAVRAIVEAETGWLEKQESGPLVEIALPVEFLDLDVEAWPYPVYGGDAPGAGVPTVPLGIHHDVVVRGVTRPRTPKVRWRERWERLHAAPRPKVHCVPAAPGAGADWRERIHIALAEDAEAALAVLGPGIGGDVGTAALGSALVSGYPYLLWDRRGPLDGAFLEELEAALSSQAGTPGSRLVREAVRHLRRNGRRTDDGGGPPRRIALFHEDPNRPLPSIAADARPER